MIYIVSQWYLPVNNPPANRMGQLVRVLIEKYGADQVRVVTGRPSFPSGSLPPEYRWRWFKKRQGPHGETIDHLYEWPAPFIGVWQKTFGYLTFAFSLFCYFLFRRMRKQDLVYVTSGPGFPAYVIRMLSRLKKNMRYMMDVRDLWPQVLAAVTGFMKKDSLGYRWLDAQTIKAYRNASGMVGNSDGIVACIDQINAPKKTRLLYNPVDGDVFRPLDEDEVEAFQKKHAALFGKPERRTFLFYGSHAHYNDLTLLMQVLNRLKEEGRDFLFIFIGEGDAKAELVARVQDYDLKEHTVFLSYMDKPELVRYINAVDYGFSSVKNDPTLTYMLPTKIPEFLACNTFVLGMVHEPLASLFREAEVALVSPPGDEDRLLENLRTLMDGEKPDRKDRRRRAFMEAVFSVEPFAENVRKIFSEWIPE